MNPLTPEIIGWAQAAQRVYKIPASLNLSAAILESGLGAATPPNSNNWHGIKSAHSGPATRTREQKPDGEWYEIEAPFAIYPDPAASFMAYAKLLGLGAPYHDAVSAYLLTAMLPRDVRNLTTAIAKSYASALNYGVDLISIQEQRNLYQYDTGGTPMADATPAPDTHTKDAVLDPFTGVPVAPAAPAPAAPDKPASDKPAPDAPAANEPPRKVEHFYPNAKDTPAAPDAPPPDEPDPVPAPAPAAAPTVSAPITIDWGSWAAQLLVHAEPIVAAAATAGVQLALNAIPMGSIIGDFIVPQRLVPQYVAMAATAVEGQVQNQTLNVGSGGLAGVVTSIAVNLFTSGEPEILKFLDGLDITSLITAEVAKLKL